MNKQPRLTCERNKPAACGPHARRNRGNLMSILKVDKMSKYRREKIDDAVAREAAVILRSINDPRVAGAMLSVTGASVAPDLKTAKIFVSPLADVDEKELMTGLRSAAGYFRSSLARALDLRATPVISFELDDGMRRSAHIAEILRKVAPADGESADGESEHNDNGGDNVGGSGEDGREGGAI